MSAGERTRADRADDTASLSDDALVARLADGDQEAWNEITRRTSARWLGMPGTCCATGPRPKTSPRKRWCG